MPVVLEALHLTYKFRAEKVVNNSASSFFNLDTLNELVDKFTTYQLTKSATQLIKTYSDI